MTRQIVVVAGFALGLLFGAGAGTVYAQSAGSGQGAEPVYGSQLMTQEEREAFRQRMREAKTQEERERIRAEHHKEMQERARKRGVSLPKEPPARGYGKGKGMGRGPRR